MIYDCFISHQHEDIQYVEALVAELEKRGLICWYAPRNITGSYAKAITEGIRNSKVFLLLLNSRSAVSQSVLDEVELAYNVSKSSPYAVIQPVCMETLDPDNNDYQEMFFYIRRLQFANVEKRTIFAEIADVILEKQPQLKKETDKRTKSQYVVQEIEDRRLQMQNQLLSRFDAHVYRKVLQQYAAPAVLDVGCGSGDMLAGMLTDIPVSAVVGIDRSDRQIEAAKAKHSGQKYHFFALDVESEAFAATLEAIKTQTGIHQFDVINISMLLLHLQDPQRLLQALRTSLAPNGTVIIRDIDDGINFAYPDPDNAFERIYKMCDHDEQSGNRHNGRRIFCDLVNAGYTGITLEAQGLSSVSMNREEKEALFRMYFPFTLQNAGIMLEKYPWNKEYQADHQWYAANFDRIHQAFLEPDFVFSLGFMTYTAGK